MLKGNQLDYIRLIIARVRTRKASVDVHDLIRFDNLTLTEWQKKQKNPKTCLLVDKCMKNTLTEKTRQPTTLYFSALKHFTKCSNNNVKKDARTRDSYWKKLRKHRRLQLFQKTSWNQFSNFKKCLVFIHIRSFNN